MTTRVLRQVAGQVGNVDVTDAGDLAVIFDDDTPGEDQNIRSARALQSPVTNTLLGATNLGSRSAGATTGVTANYGTISGGDLNQVSGVGASVGGGVSNTASANHACVPGGTGNVASGVRATAFGNGCTASGINATAFGSGCTAGDNGVAGGVNCAAGSGSVALGTGNTASGATSTALGEGTTASGLSSFAACGNATVASGAYAAAIGDQCTAAGDASHAEGQLTVVTAAGDRGHAEGLETSVAALQGHAEGQETSISANADNGHAEGRETSVSGRQGHAEGLSTSVAVGAHQGHAEGEFSIAGGINSHAQNDSCIALGVASDASGNQANALRETQRSFSSGRWGAVGDAQRSGLVLKLSVPAVAGSGEMKFGEGNDQLLTLENSRSYYFEARITFGYRVAIGPVVSSGANTYRAAVHTDSAGAITIDGQNSDVMLGENTQGGGALWDTSAGPTRLRLMLTRTGDGTAVCSAVADVTFVETTFQV